MRELMSSTEVMTTLMVGLMMVVVVVIVRLLRVASYKIEVDPVSHSWLAELRRGSDELTS